MEKEFIPYELALELDKLGFNEPCMLAYHPDLYLEQEEGTITPEFYEDGITNEELKYITIELNEEQRITTEGFIDSYTGPTWNQAFRWFREKYNLKGFIGFRPNVKQFDCHVYDMSLSGTEYVKQRTLEEFNKDPKVGTYEEAELECLKKLIEIVKNK